MGVDYTANYGIGVKVIFNEDIEDPLDWLDDIIGDNKFEYFEVGSGSYTGESDDVYLCLNNPDIMNRENFDIQLEHLEKFIKDNKINTEGKIDLVGGLNIW